MDHDCLRKKKRKKYHETMANENPLENAPYGIAAPRPDRAVRSERHRFSIRCLCSL